LNLYQTIADEKKLNFYDDKKSVLSIKSL